MKIQELHIKNFGKFTDKHIYFPEQVQVIYGENEYGKSTIYAFIKAMLFGLERGKGRAAANDDFSRYEPWENPNYYAGMMRFSCGGRNFRLERNFDRYTKNASLICEDDGEELSVEDGDLNMLLGGISASSFENTAAIGQLTAKPGALLAAELKNYAANYYETGSGDIDLQGAIERIKARKRQAEQELKKYREACEKKIEKQIAGLRYAETEAERLNSELEEKRTELERENGKQRKAEEMSGGDKRRGKTGYGKKQAVAGGICGLVGLLLFLISRGPGRTAHAFGEGLFGEGLFGEGLFGEGLFSVGVFYVGLFCVLLGAILVFDGIRKCRKQEKRGGHNVKSAGDIHNGEETDDRIRLKELEWEIRRLREEYKEKQLLCGNLKEQIAELETEDETERELNEKLGALQLAELKLQEAAEDMVNRSGERLNREASRILCELTERKYTRLFVDERLEMSVLSDGKKIAANRLSRGTIEQLYFSLRMAALLILYEEELPVILDDAFAFYDEKRLKSALKWLSEQPRQVIIFSCQTRERELLDSL